MRYHSACQRLPIIPAPLQVQAPRSQCRPRDAEREHRVTRSSAHLVKRRYHGHRARVVRRLHLFHSIARMQKGHVHLRICGYRRVQAEVLVDVGGVDKGHVVV